MLRAMPFLSLTTNVSLTSETESALSDALSKTLATQLKKPEAYVMISMRPACPIRFAGSEAPAAFMEIKSVGMPHDLNPATEALTRVVSAQCCIPRERIYITVTDVPSPRWAQGGSTFA